MPVSTLHVNQVPVSLNKIGSRGNRWSYGRAKKQLQEEIAQALMVAAVPRDLGFVEATAMLRFPTLHRRDEGNFRWLLEKCLGDALVGDKKVWPQGLYLPDDDAEHFRFGAVAFDPERGQPRTLIHLNWRF